MEGLKPNRRMELHERLNAARNAVRPPEEPTEELIVEPIEHVEPRLEVTYRKRK